MSTVAHLFGIALIFFGALLVNRIAGYKARRSFFLIELPGYKLPSLKRAFLSMCARGWAYIVKAATIILLCNTAVQLMQTFRWDLTVAASADQSILASVAAPLCATAGPDRRGALLAARRRSGHRVHREGECRGHPSGLLCRAAKPD